MPRLLIIADDFTGSLDTAVQFAKWGASTLVETMRDGKADLALPCEVLAINTDSRHIPAKLAYERVAHLVKTARTAGFTHIYKKTDSTFRGNIGSELAAVIENSAQAELIFIPAYPKAGRCIIGGKHFVKGVPLTKTEFASDPLNPVRHDAVADIIREQTDTPIRNVSYGHYETLKRAPKATKTITVVDGRNDDELRQIGRVLNECGKLACLGGCAGFAELLPELLGFEKREPLFRISDGGKMLVSGSINPLAQRQVNYAIRHLGYADFSLSVEQKLADKIESEQCKPLLHAVKDGKKTALWTKGAKEDIKKADDEAKKRKLPLRELPNRIAGNLGALAALCLRAKPDTTLIVFGGDTLKGISESIGCSAVKPITEILPGVVLARFFDEAFSGTDIITKAGGFGKENVVEQIESFLSAAHNAIEPAPGR